MKRKPSAFIQDNITLINPLVWEGYFKVQRNGNDGEAFVEGYLDFVNRNKSRVQMLNEAMLNGTVRMLNESATGIPARILNEAIKISEDWGKTTGDPAVTAGVVDLDGYTEGGVDGGGLTDGDINYVENKGEREAQSMGDIHYFVQTTYDNLVKNKENYDKFSPLSLMNTTKAYRMDALFAFMNIPNMRFEPNFQGLDVWDTSNVVDMTGMFYRSSFNNNSIQDWDVSGVLKADAMFEGCALNDPNVIRKWKMKGVTPKIGSTSRDRDAEAGEYAQARISNLKKKMSNLEKSVTENRLLSFDEYVQAVNEGRFLDTMKSFAGNVKDAAKTIVGAFKSGLGYIVAGGKTICAVTAEWLKNVANSVSGVQVAINNFNSLDIPDGEYYSNPEGAEADLMRKNLITFLNGMAKGGEVSESYVNERVSFTNNAKNGEKNVGGAEDVGFDETESLIKRAFLRNIKNGGTGGKKILCFWGAPGVGKTTAIKAVVKAMNEGKSADEQVGIIHVDCSQLPTDGFFIPRKPEEKVVNLSDGVSVTVANSEFAPNTWLPVYKPLKGTQFKDLNPNQIAELEKKLDDIANLANLDEKISYTGDDKTLMNKEFNITRTVGGGGILLFDELLRANPIVLPQIMNLLQSRTYSGFKLGSKWTMVCCSNRPNDDNQVRDTLNKQSTALLDRLQSFHLTPDYQEWCNYMKNRYEKKDKDLLDCMFKFINEVPIDGDQSRWHNMDVEDIMDKNQVATVSPRSWDQLLEQLNEDFEIDGISFKEMVHNQGDPAVVSSLRKTCAGFITKELADAFLKRCALWLPVPGQKVKGVFDGSFDDMLSGNVFKPSKGKSAGEEFHQAYLVMLSGLQNNYGTSKPLSASALYDIIMWFYNSFGTYARTSQADFAASVVIPLYKYYAFTHGIKDSQGLYDDPDLGKEEDNRGGIFWLTAKPGLFSTGIDNGVVTGKPGKLSEVGTAFANWLEGPNPMDMQDFFGPIKNKN